MLYWLVKGTSIRTRQQVENNDVAQVVSLIFLITFGYFLFNLMYLFNKAPKIYSLNFNNKETFKMLLHIAYNNVASIFVKIVWALFQLYRKDITFESL